jgi:hypothetical protein
LKTSLSHEDEAKLQADLECGKTVKSWSHQTKKLTRKTGKAMKHIFAGFNLIGAIPLLRVTGGSAGTNLLSSNKELLI